MLAEKSRAKIDASLVREQLERILGSHHFKSSIRISQFLRYVTEAALEGRVDEIKETSIGVSVYGKDPSYDPKIDTLVRSEARRLRQKLERYLEEGGQRDAVRITLPKGRYIPVFEWNVVTEDPRTEEELASKTLVNATHLSFPYGELKTPSDPPQGIAQAVGALEDQSRPRLRRITAGLLLAGVLVAASGLGYLWRARHTDQWGIALKITPLTTFPGESYQPSLSPDGQSIAFIWNNSNRNYNIYVMQPGGKPLRVTSDPDVDLHPAWSPDGKSLAFLRVSSADAQVMIVPFPGGQEKRLFALRSPRPWSEDLLGVRSDAGPTWAPDGKGLIVSDTAPSGHGLALYEFNLETQQLRPLTSPPADDRDLSPALSPDGSWIAFVRFSSYDSADVYVVPVGSDQEQRLTFDHADIQGLTWREDGPGIIFSSNRDGAYSLWSIHPGRSGLFPILTTGESAMQPTISRDGSLMVYADFSLRSNIFKVNLDQQHSDQASIKLVPSIRSSHSAQYSPDGSKIAFVSDRSGKWELWVAAADGNDPYQLTDFEGATVGSPRWSPDSKLIAFDARPKGHSEIFVVSANGHQLQALSLKNTEEKQPAWSPDGKWIYFNTNRGGPMQLWRMEPSGANASSVSTISPTDVQFAPSGNSIFYTNAREGLWQLKLAGGSPSLVPGLEHRRFGRLWTVTGSGIYFVDISTDRTKLRFYDFLSKTDRVVADFPLEALIGYPSLSYSQRENAILFAAKEDMRSDLMTFWAKKR
ncbi:MAG TPA: hypothetical protein VGM27_03880 [Acidobacteriaceae bacterium]